MFSKNNVQPFYNENGQLAGVFISATTWHEHEPELEEILFPDRPEASKSRKSMNKEPMADWEKFISFWDFNYPFEKKVRCDNCGSSTEDWTTDDPKKFRLLAANLGGLVSFLCSECNYRVSKKHFKDHIHYECTPFTCNIK